MIRKEAISIISKKIGSQSIISANGFISRDLFEANDRNSNFYMIGSMGLASSIGLGLALKNPKKRFFIFDGDGNILMNLGSLTTIGKLRPKNLVHVIFDNYVHESTGSQPTNSNVINIKKIAAVCNYAHTYAVSDENNLSKVIHKTKKLNGPIMILVKIQQNKNIKSERIKISPIKIKERFMQSI